LVIIRIIIVILSIIVVILVVLVVIDGMSIVVIDGTHLDFAFPWRQGLPVLATESPKRMGSALADIAGFDASGELSLWRGHDTEGAALRFRIRQDASEAGNRLEGKEDSDCGELHRDFVFT
jgi:hypothetical protein